MSTKSSTISMICSSECVFSQKEINNPIWEVTVFQWKSDHLFWSRYKNTFFTDKDQRTFFCLRSAPLTITQRQRQQQRQQRPQRGLTTATRTRAEESLRRELDGDGVAADRSGRAAEASGETAAKHWVLQHHTNKTTTTTTGSNRF